jgi:hypothetical protein
LRSVLLASARESDVTACSRLSAGRIPACVGKAKVSGNIVQRHEHGKPGDRHLNDEELKAAIVEQTKELAELDPEFAEFAKQLVQ